MNLVTTALGDGVASDRVGICRIQLVATVGAKEEREALKDLVDSPDADQRVVLLSTSD